VGGKGPASKNKKIVFSGDMEDSYDEDELLDKSYELLGEGEKKDMTIAHVHPQFFRELQYMVSVSPDVLTPRSADLERAFSLETYDRLVKNPAADQEKLSNLC
jgi:hypothetical protein